MNSPRVRFAPSPTGYLHVGGARTALFNWLWARKTGGTFVLRIEDTDQARSTRESVEAIFDAMRWLGLDWDEGPKNPDDLGGGPHGPYFQMRRLDLYKQFADKLIQGGHAYRCYATPEEIEAERNKLPADKRERFRFVSPWRDKNAELDKPHVVRFKSPSDGDITFKDLVMGDIRTPNNTQTDFILLRTDGVPLYNFGCVIDDLTMSISMVARGKDHIINTAPQILIYNALKEAPPTFAHLPMMMRSKTEKLSKRHGAVSVTQYRDLGWTADGLLSYLVRFGWSHGDEEVFTLASLVEKFDWAHVGKSDGIFDARKCAAINARHAQKLVDDDAFAKQVATFLGARGVSVASDDPRLRTALSLHRERADAKVEFPEGMSGPFTLGMGPYAFVADAAEHYFREKPEFDPKARDKFLVPDSAAHLEAFASQLATINDFTVENIKTTIEAWLASQGLEIKTVAQPARVALTGRSASPGLYEVIALLGRDVSTARLIEGARMAREGAAK